MEQLIFGHTWEEIQAMQNRTYTPRCIKTPVGADYGSDPLGNGRFRMVPSGDIVDFAERNRRLGRTR